MTGLPAPDEALNRALATLVGGSTGLGRAEGVVAADAIFGSLAVPVAPFNTVAAARFATGEADRRIEEILGWFDARGMPTMWWLGPTDTPADLGDRLVRHGLELAEDGIPGMVAGLDTLPDEAPADGVTVELVRDTEAFEVAIDVMIDGFGIPADIGAPLRHFADRGFDAVPWRFFLARLDGRPAGTALGVVAEEDLGVFNVATVDWARRRGVGRAVTLATMRDGAALGCRQAVLQSTVLGHSVYEALGFRDFATYRAYLRQARV